MNKLLSALIAGAFAVSLTAAAQTAAPAAPAKAPSATTAPAPAATDKMAAPASSAPAATKTDPSDMWWLGRFQYGPVEWLWRFATYGHPPAMLSRANAAAPVR